MTDKSHCWACGVDQDPQRPNRADYDSDPAYLVACLVWLDHEYPERLDYARRVAELERLERESDPAYVRSRLRELLDADDPESAAEWQRLVAIYRTNTQKERNRS